MISVLPQLDYLDHIKITEIQRKMAKAHATTYAGNGKSYHFEDLYKHGLNRRIGKHGSNIPKLITQKWWHTVQPTMIYHIKLLSIIHCDIWYFRSEY